MKPVLAKDCLSNEILRVHDEDRPKSDSKLFAVFKDPKKKHFLGLVRKSDIIHPNRIFADLIPDKPTYSINPDTPASVCEEQMRLLNVDSLPVLDEYKNFHGIVTYSTISSCLLSSKHLTPPDIQWTLDKLMKGEHANDPEKLTSPVIDLFYLSKSNLQQSRQLKKSLEMIASIMRATAGFLVLFEGENISKSFHFGLKPDHIQRLKKVREGKALFQMILKADGKSLVFNKISKDAHPPSFLQFFPDIQSFIGVSFKRNHQPFGCMVLANKLHHKRFTKSDEKLMVSFSHIFSLNSIYYQKN